MLVLVGFLGPLLACAAGDLSTDVGPGAVTPQSGAGDDGGGAANDAATTVTNPPPSSDDAGSIPPPASDDAGPPPASNDAGSSTTVDSAPPPPPPPVDAGALDSGATSTCPGYAAPSTPAGCTCNPASHPCTANGCYNGYYCNLANTKCVPKPC